jgi:cellulose synthase/poly-beta-1,6-N-acetylglucosamine synthase-like glycosyltransferase
MGNEVGERLKVDIIIPAYNAQATISETIDSALAQNYTGEFTVTVVNDGSIDDTEDIIYSYRGRVQTVRTNINNGVADARNLGARYTFGEAILFLDADDKIAPNYLSETVPLLKYKAMCGVVSTGMTYFGGIDEGKYTVPYFSTPSRNGLPTCSLIRRKAFDSVNGYDPTMVYEDWDLWLRIAQRWEICLLNLPLFFYRRSLTGRNAWQDTDREKHRKQIKERHG